MKANVAFNGNKGLANYIMGFNVFFAIIAMQEVNTHKVNGMCAHPSKNA
jgi:hypothetical protein